MKLQVGTRSEKLFQLGSSRLAIRGHSSNKMTSVLVRHALALAPVVV